MLRFELLGFTGTCDGGRVRLDDRSPRAAVVEEELQTQIDYRRRRPGDYIPVPETIAVEVVAAWGGTVLELDTGADVPGRVY